MPTRIRTPWNAIGSPGRQGAAGSLDHGWKFTVRPVRVGREVAAMICSECQERIHGFTQ